MFRRRPAPIPESEAVVLLAEAVKLLREAHGRSGDWSSPSWWVRAKEDFVARYEQAKREAREVPDA